ncbi:MAG: Maf family protein [Lachnospiraceae bacterium]|nr:Maf family protein [Lachnospiraceae bacterium]
MREYVLASSSPRRKELLQQIGMSFTTVTSRKEEVTHKTNPEEIVAELSKIKAEDVFSQGNTKKVVIGADTIVVFKGEIMGKPKDEKDAFSMLKKLQGNVHQVYTGVTVYYTQDNKEEYFSFTEKTDVECYPISDEEIWEYILTKEPMDKAGAYGIQGCFAAYIKGINGEYNNVVGLPIGRLVFELKKRNLW